MYEFIALEMVSGLLLSRRIPIGLFNESATSKNSEQPPTSEIMIGKPADMASRTERVDPPT